MSTKIEIRRYVSAVEIRNEGDGKVAVGDAIVYNKLSKNLGGFVERAMPGCADKSIKEQDVRALYNHDSSALLGRAGSGTLRLESDERALTYAVDLPDTTLGRDVATLLERGDLAGSSFGFRVLHNGDKWEQTEQGFPLRSLHEISLVEISLVPNPAYPDSTSALRSLAEATGRELAEVRSLAEANDLMSLLGEKNDDEENEEEGRETPTFHRSIHVF